MTGETRDINLQSGELNEAGCGGGRPRAVGTYQEETISLSKNAGCHTEL